MHTWRAWSRGREGGLWKCHTTFPSGMTLRPLNLPIKVCHVSWNPLQAASENTVTGRKRHDFTTDWRDAHWHTNRLPHRSPCHGLSYCFRLCSWAYTQNIYATRELQHRPMGATGGGAQSRLRQLQTNVVTVNPECNLSCIKCTSSPQRVTIKPVISPKQKQNSKHDDTEKTPWRQKRPGYRVHIYTAVLPKQHGRCGIFGVCIFFKKKEGTLGEAWESKSVNVRWEEEWKSKMLEEQKE